MTFLAGYLPPSLMCSDLPMLPSKAASTLQTSSVACTRLMHKGMNREAKEDPLDQKAEVHSRFAGSPVPVGAATAAQAMTAATVITGGALFHTAVTISPIATSTATISACHSSSIKSSCSIGRATDMCCSKKETAVATRCKWQRPSQMTLQAAGLGNSGVVGKCHSAACRQWRCLHVQFRYDCRSHLCHYQHPHHRRHLTTRLLRRNYASFTNYNFDFKNVKIV